MDPTRPTSFKTYYLHVLSQAWHDAWGNVKGAIVTVVCAMGASYIRAHWGLLEPRQQWLTAVANTLPALGICFIFLLYYVIRAPWKLRILEQGNLERLRRDMTRAHEAVRSQMATAHTETLSQLAQLDNSTKGEIASLKTALAKERANLDGCPQIVLEYGNYGIGDEGFFVHNSIAHARAVNLEVLESPNYLLTADIIHYIDKSQHVPLVLRATKKETSGVGGPKEASHVEAWKLFAMDIFAGKIGVGDTVISEENWVEEVGKIMSNITSKQLVISVALLYSDLFGKCYRSPAKVTWSGLGRRPEVRPDPIAKVPCQSASAAV